MNQYSGMRKLKKTSHVLFFVNHTQGEINLNRIQCVKVTVVGYLFAYSVFTLFVLLYVCIVDVLHRAITHVSFISYMTALYITKLYIKLTIKSHGIMICINICQEKYIIADNRYDKAVIKYL